MSFKPIESAEADPNEALASLASASTIHEAHAHAHTLIRGVLLPWFESLSPFTHFVILVFFAYRLINDLLHPDYPRHNFVFKPIEWLIRLPFRLTHCDRLLAWMCCRARRKSMINWAAF